MFHIQTNGTPRKHATSTLHSPSPMCVCYMAHRIHCGPFIQSSALAQINNLYHLCQRYKIPSTKVQCLKEM